MACVNVHWLRAPAEGGQHSFHVEGLSQHLLRDANGIRALSRAIKNILDYGADKRLRALCSALDAYRETVVRNREAANAQRKQGGVVLPESQTERQKRGRLLPPDCRRGGASHEKEDRISRPSDEPVQPLQTERRSRRAKTTARREVRSEVNVAPKVGRTSYKRTSKAVEYD